MNRIKELYFSSFTYFLYTLIRDRILNNKLYLFFTDFSFISALWHKSFIYTQSQKRFYSFAKKIYSRSFTLSASFCIYALFPSVLLPISLWHPLQSLILILIVQLSAIHYAVSPLQCCDFIIYFIACSILLIITYAAALPYAYTTIIHIFSALTVYYLISKLITSERNIPSALTAVFMLNISLCVINISSCLIGQGFVTNTNTFNDIIILTTPLTLAFFFNNRSKFRSYAYSTFMLVLTFIATAVTTNIEAVIAYGVCIILFTAFSKPKYLLVIFLIFPGVILFSLNRFWGLWSKNAMTDTGIEEIMYAAVNFWSNGLSFRTDEFLQIYSDRIFQNSSLEIAEPILLGGRIILFIILWYTLKIIRSAIFDIPKATVTERRILSAVLSSVIGFSVSGIIGCSDFESGGILCYWIILGILSTRLRLSNQNRV